MNMKDGAEALNKIADLLATLVQSFGPRIEREGYFEHPKRMYQNVVSNSNATLYTAPPAPPQGPPPKAKITELIVVNNDSAERTFTMYSVPSGGTAGVSNCIFNAVKVPANSTTLFELDTIMEASEFIQGFASVSSQVAFRISGVEYLVGLNT